MSYSQVQTATATGSAVAAQVTIALIKQAAIRSSSATTREEKDVCHQIVSATMPSSWLSMVVIILDLMGALPTPTDTQVDTAIVTGGGGASAAWTYLTSVTKN